MSCTPRAGHWGTHEGMGSRNKTLVTWALVSLLSLAQTHGSQGPRLLPVRVRGRSWMSGERWQQKAPLLSTLLASPQYPVLQRSQGHVACGRGCPHLTGFWNLGAIDAQPITSDLLPTGDKGTVL